MKTFAKALIASGFGLLGTFGDAQAALPYSYTSGSYGSGYGVAAGGCFDPPKSDRYDSGYGSSYRPASYGRSGYGYSTPSRSAYDDRFRTRPYSSTHYGTSYGKWDGDCDVTPSRLSSKPSSYRDRYDDCYDGSPLFEPWRPANVSHRLGR